MWCYHSLPGHRTESARRDDGLPQGVPQHRQGGGTRGGGRAARRDLGGAGGLLQLSVSGERHHLCDAFSKARGAFEGCRLIDTSRTINAMSRFYSSDESLHSGSLIACMCVARGFVCFFVHLASSFHVNPFGTPFQEKRPKNKKHKGWCCQNRLRAA